MSYPNTNNNVLYTQQQQPQQFQQQPQQQAGGVKEQIQQFVQNPHVPSNQSAINQLDKAAYSLNQTQASSNAQLLGPNNQRIVQDVQSLIQDEKNIIAHKNEGDALQKVIHDAKALGHKLGGKVEGGDVSILKSLVNDWKHIFDSITGGDEAKDLANTGNSLFRGLGDTEEFLDLVSELINLVKILISQADARITKDSSKQGELRENFDEEREVVMDKVRATLNTLAANDLWTHLVQQGKNVAHQTAREVRDNAPNQSQIQSQINQAAPKVQGNIWELLDSQEMHVFTEDLKQFLQRLVGPEHSVAPLFDYTKAGLRDIKNDRELHIAIHKAEDTLHSVSMGVNEAVDAAADTPANHSTNPAYSEMTQYHAANPSHSIQHNNADPQQRAEEAKAHAHEAQEQLKSVASHLEAALNNIRNNQNIHAARVEAHILKDAFINDPDNRQLIADARKLWSDLHAPNGGLDPTLLIGLREAVVPMFLERFNNVPIPTIHNTVSMLGKMSFTIQGITLSIPQILPDDIYVKFEYEMDTTIRSLDVHAQRLYMHLELRNIHLHLRNVAWAYQRLSHPRRSDSGHMDLDTLGDGITIKLKVQMHTDHSVEVKEAHVNVQKFKTTFRDSKHNKLYSGLAHVFANQIKKNVQKSVEEKLREMGAQMGGKLMQTLGNVQQKSTAMFGQAMGKKQQIFEMLSNRRGQHQEKDKDGLKSKAQTIRENSIFKSAVHKASGSAINSLDKQQERVNDMKDNAHEHKLEKDRMDHAAAASHGIAPTLPSTNRPASPPVPAMTFIPDISSNVSTAPITSGHGLTHVTPNNAIDSRPITDPTHHTVDPIIQRALEEKLNLNKN